MHSIGSRLRVWRDLQSLKQEDAAKMIGLSPGTYQNYERDIRAPNAESMALFAAAGINTNWLLTGEGRILREPEESPARGHRVAEKTAVYDSSGFVRVALYDDMRGVAEQGAAASHAELGDILMFRADWLRFELGCKPQDLCLIRVTGKSMEPTLSAGDVILVDQCARRPDREGIYIMRSGGMLVARRLHALPEGKIRVSSDNDPSSCWDMRAEDLENGVAIIGRVVWFSRRVG